MDYNERACLISEAVNPAHLPNDVLSAKCGAQNRWDGEPVTDWYEGDRVWHQPAMGRGWYALVLANSTDPVTAALDGVTILAEKAGTIATVPPYTLTLLRRA